MKLTYTDFQTGLKNERFLNKYLSKKKEQLISIAVLDIDSFKALNDKYGYENVDELLKRIVIRFQGVINDKNCILIRYKQGDEFIFVFKDKHKYNLKILSKIQNDSVKGFKMLDDSTIKITYTIGYFYNRESKNNKLVLQYANLALRYGKQNQKGTIVCAHKKDEETDLKFNYCRQSSSPT